MQYLKILDEESNENQLVLIGAVALYGGKDLTGEDFGFDTDFKSSYIDADMVAVDWEHGVRPDPDSVNGKNTNQAGRHDILGKVDVQSLINDPEYGLLAKYVLDRRKKYVDRFIAPLAKAELLGTSSEAISEFVEKDKDGHISRWPLRRVALTVNPMEKRMLTEAQLIVAKSLAEDIPAFKSYFAEAEKESGANSDEGATKHNKEVNNMAEMHENIENDAVTKAVFQEKIGEFEAKLDSIVSALEKIPMQKKAGIDPNGIVDETDKAIKAHPFKFGLKMQAVRQATLNPGGMTYEHKAILGQNESVPQDGGFLVGTEQSTELEKKMHEQAVFSSRATQRTITQGANSIDFYGRKENSRAAGSRYGGVRVYKVGEGQTITASQMEWYKYTLKPSKYAALVYATDEVINDSGLLQQEIMEAVPAELSFELDNDLFRGASAGYPQGILGANCLIPVTRDTSSEVNSADIIAMWARRWVRGNYVWFVNQDVTPQLHALSQPVGTGGALTYMPPGGLSAAPYGTLYGRPVIETEFNSTLGSLGDIVLVDWSQYKYASVGGMQVASSMHVQFVTDQMAWRFTDRHDGQMTWESALTPFQGTNTVSPVVALAA